MCVPKWDFKKKYKKNLERDFLSHEHQFHNHRLLQTISTKWSTGNVPEFRPNFHQRREQDSTIRQFRAEYWTLAMERIIVQWGSWRRKLPNLSRGHQVVGRFTPTASDLLETFNVAYVKDLRNDEHALNKDAIEKLKSLKVGFFVLMQANPILPRS